MPNLKSKKVSQIIECLDTGKHTIEIKPKPWRRLLKHAHLSGAITKAAGTYTVSREQLLGMSNKRAKTKCLAILMWGYPSGGRGKNIQKALTSLHSLAKAASQPQPTWDSYYQSVNQIAGVGISTITKFAYFFRHRFSGHRAVILDSQIAKTLEGQQWINAPDPVGKRSEWPNNYLTYLEQIDDVAQSLRVKPDQIELFLYLIGPHFR